MASHFQARLTLLHVIAIPTSWYGELPPVEYEELWDLEFVRKQRQTTMDSFLTGELSAAPQVERIVEQGDPATVISHYAESRKPDLIMLPTHGHGLVRRLLLGSVTAKVLHDVRLPVWTDVHEAGSVARSGCKSVLCAVDPAEEALPSVRWAASYADSYGAELILAHVIPAIDPGLPIPDDAIFHRYLADTSRRRLAQLRQRAGVTAKICITAGQVAPAIRDAALEHQADLVVIGQGREHDKFAGLKSNAYSIIRESPCPVVRV